MNLPKPGFSDWICNRSISFGINKIVIIWVLSASISSVIYFKLKFMGIIGPGTDTWIFDNALHNTVSGRGLFRWLPHHYDITPAGEFDDISQLSLHAQPFLFLLVPIYYFAPSVYTLLILQAFALGLAALPLYYFVDDILGKRSAHVITLSYLIYPTIVLITRFFHIISFLPLFFFMMLYSIKKKKTWLFLLSLALGLSLKENVPFLLAPVGVWLMYDAFTKQRIITDEKWNIYATAGIIVSSVIWFIVAIFAFIPSFRSSPRSSGYVARYGSLGGSRSEIIKNAIFRPDIVLSVILAQSKVTYAISMFIPLAFVPLRSPLLLVIGSPVLLQNLLSSLPVQQTFYYQHQVMFVLLLILGVVVSLSKHTQERREIYEDYLITMSLCSIVLYIPWFVIDSLLRYNVLI